MSGAVAHRGPDSDGDWLSEPDGLVFAHRRLAIFGPGESGDQPMHSASGRYVLIFNGAIYNYVELREDLRARGLSFRGTSDTEVLLSLIESVGLEAALARCVGMFALALWDTGEKRLCIARDRVGEKPLFYSFANGELRFGSELAVFDTASLDQDAVTSFLDFGFSATADTVLGGVVAVPPGAIIQVSVSTTSVTPQFYWRPEGRSSATEMLDDRTVSTELETRLREAVRLQLRADVPLGLFLSGGMDSTLVATIASEIGGASLPSFSIGFEDDRFNELPTAQRTAKRLGLKHHGLILDDKSILDQVASWFDDITEPLADPSIVPTRALTAFAREHVTTVITGDGGDELFGGYERYRSGAALWRMSQRVPHSLTRLASATARRLPGSVLDLAGRLVGGRSNVEEPSRRINKALAALSADDYESLRRALVAKTALPQADVADQPPVRSADELISRLMDDDLVSYLPGSVLSKLDRCAMSVGLEARAPFLDHRIVQWSRTLPVDVLVNDRAGKRPVRELVARLGGGDIAKDVKRGFSPPLASWLRGPLNDYWRDTLTPDAVQDWPDVTRARVARLASLTQRSIRGQEYEIWHALTLAAWHKRHKAVFCA